MWVGHVPMQGLRLHRKYRGQVTGVRLQVAVIRDWGKEVAIDGQMQLRDVVASILPPCGGKADGWGVRACAVALTVGLIF